MAKQDRSRNLLFPFVLMVAVQTASVAAHAEQTVSFSLDVLPILQNHCVRCHHPGGKGYEASGLDLRTYTGVMKGTRHGKIVVPGEPLTSNLMALIEGRSDPSIRMPHKKWPLLKQQIEIIAQWVRQGAKNN